MTNDVLSNIGATFILAVGTILVTYAVQGVRDTVDYLRWRFKKVDKKRDLL